MKPTFTPAILPSQKKTDGTYNVKIHVTFKRKTKRLSTNITATSKDLTKDLKLKEGPVKRKAYELAEQMRSVCEEIDYFLLQTMDVEDIVKYFDVKSQSKAKFRLDFLDYMYQRAPLKGAATKLYVTSANVLARFLNGRTLDVNDVTVRFLRQFEEFIRKEPKIAPAACLKRGKASTSKIPKGDCRAVSLYLNCFRHMFLMARQEYNDPDLDIYRIPNNPFEYYKVPIQKPAKRRNKSQEFIQMVINESAKAKGAERFALEVFLLSFALEGMNLVDLYKCGPAKGRWLNYNRSKTSSRRMDFAEHQVYIPEQILPIVERMRDNDGEHQFIFHRRYKDFASFTNNTNTSLKKWRLSNDVEHFTMYAARHSFASIGRRAGIEKATIDEMLCHVGDMKMADVYIEKDWNIHKEANDKILSLFDWSQIQ